jgi:hypothetical protein
MDLNDYTLMLLLQDRHTEMVVAAQRNALLREATRLRRPFRAMVGSALIRLDAWLQAFSPVQAASAMDIVRRDGDSTINTRDGAFPDERDRHRMGAHAVARDAAGGVGGLEEDGLIKLPPKIELKCRRAYEGFDTLSCLDCVTELTRDI